MSDELTFPEDVAASFDGTPYQKKRVAVIVANAYAEAFAVCSARCLGAQVMYGPPMEAAGDGFQQSAEAWEGAARSIEERMPSQKLASDRKGPA